MIQVSTSLEIFQPRGNLLKILLLEGNTYLIFFVGGGAVHLYTAMSEVSDRRGYTHVICLATLIPNVAMKENFK